ncbi:MAG: ribonuclease HI family protein [Fimbriimonadales bacterium]|nr:ribonuclease HI family protein [Fimbriimonadales bacterium]
MKLYLYTDGSSIGNPGKAGAAFLLKDESGATVAQGCEAIGVATNNQAEYRALLKGLEAARGAGADALEWFSDSELLVRQWTGAYKIKDPQLRALMENARKLAEGIQIIPHAVPRNSLPEMETVDNWARGVALGRLKAASGDTVP